MNPYQNFTSFNMSDNAQKVFYERYVQKDEFGNPTEDFNGTFQRVAQTVASVEQDITKRSYYTQEFYNLISSFYFVPNSPTFTGAGTHLGQLAACFVLPIVDDMGKESGGIFDTLKNAALIQQTGGGNGFSFSNLRPHGDSVRNSSGIATGPIGFLKVYDKAFGEIAQGGTRRGANMAILRVDHPDIEEFIQCKSIEGDITNFNISVGITDKFMLAVENNDTFDLINPRDNKVWKTINARYLFDLIVRQAYRNGEPGVIFLDALNRDNPVPSLFTIEATNPCAEQGLGPYENCCLGSINLAKILNDDNHIDWIKLENIVRLSTRFLDNVIDANKYVPSVPQLKDIALRIRRIGLGIMGLADLFYKLNIRYGSNTSVELASQLMEFIRYVCMDESINLAIEKGSFPEINNSIYSSLDFRWNYPKPLNTYKINFNRPNIDWKLLISKIKTYGIRNAVQTTIAPTGTIGTVSDVEGYGCEPVFALSYTRYLQDKDSRRELKYISPIFENTIKLNYNGNSDYILDKVRVSGNIKSLGFNDELLESFVVSSDITVDEHILMQASLQRFIDNAISKTCNFPEDATIEDVENAYIKAWNLGCKGLTVYITGSREKVVLETKETQLKKVGYFDEASMCKDGVCSI